MQTLYIPRLHRMFHNFTTTWWVVCNCLQTSSYLSWKLLATTTTCYLPKLLSWSQNCMNLHEPVVEYTVLTSDCIYHRVTNRFLGLYERELSNQLHAIANNLQQWLTTVPESAFFPQRFLGSHQQVSRLVWMRKTIHSNRQMQVEKKVENRQWIHLFMTEHHLLN